MVGCPPVPIDTDSEQNHAGPASKRNGVSGPNGITESTVVLIATREFWRAESKRHQGGIPRNSTLNGGMIDGAGFLSEEVEAPPAVPVLGRRTPPSP